MKFTAATLSLMAVSAEALLDLSVKLPLGLEIDLDTFGPKPDGEPCPSCADVWHPPHDGVEIDDCDDVHNEGWHWVHPCEDCHHPDTTYSWALSTITATRVRTIVECAPDVPDCPARATTVTVAAETTVCPIPVAPRIHAAAPTAEVGSVLPPAPAAAEAAAPVPPAATPLPAPSLAGAAVVPPVGVVPEQKAYLSNTPANRVDTVTVHIQTADVAVNTPAPVNTPTSVNPPAVVPTNRLATPVNPPADGNRTFMSPLEPTSGAAQNVHSVGVLLALGLVAAALL